MQARIGQGLGRSLIFILFIKPDRSGVDNRIVENMTKSNER